MIISRTPLRISFFSGGSDMPSFYKKETGAALSATINKYVYVMVHETPHMGESVELRTIYDIVESHANVEKMKHLITKESLKMFDKTKGLTIGSISDIFSRGSGLGSSSAFTVGLINALNSNSINIPTRTWLAESACEVEMNRCEYPVGKQDQYAAAFGGFNLFEFHKDNKVGVKNIFLSKQTIGKLERNLLLVYSGFGRSANDILQKQQSAMSNLAKFEMVRRSRDKAYIAQDMLTSGNVDDFGKLLHEGWLDKKAVESSITNNFFDNIYESALRAGATGGKLLGAGGGGFFLFYAPEDTQTQVKEAITKSSEGSCIFYDFKFDDKGSQIVSIS